MRGLLTSVLCVTALLAAPAHARNLTVFAAASTVQVLDEIRNEWNAETKHPGCASSTAPAARSPGRLDAGGTRGYLLFRQQRPGSTTSSKTGTRSATTPAANGVPQPDRPRRSGLGSHCQPTSQFAGQLQPLDDIGAALGSERPAGDRRPATRPRRHIRHARPSAGSACGRATRISTVRTRNVRLALALVQRGEAPLGIVYYTDAIQTGQVRIVATINGALHAPVAYQAVAVATTNRRTEHRKHGTAR